VSAVSAIADVRKRLVELQKEMGKAGGVILDGRDIGTTVFPNADLKVFLTASSLERALRRQKQQAGLGIHQELQAIKEEIEKRDYLDCNRKVSPLRQAPDAVLLDTDSLAIDEVVEQIAKLIEDKLL
jgi:cytidylate kinase